MLRAFIHEFPSEKDTRLSLVGAFGYDLLFQFDPIELKLPRDGRKDLHLFLCDDIYYMDRKREVIERFQYDFAPGELTTAGLPAHGEAIPAASDRLRQPDRFRPSPGRVHGEGRDGTEGMKQGDYYEVVLRQTFSAPFGGSPSELFERVQQASPSPYEFLLQLGDEQLVGASPEMFVRVEGARGRDVSDFGYSSANRRSYEGCR